MNRQIFRPSRRKKNVENSTSSMPVTTSNRVAAVAMPVEVSDAVFALIQSCALSIAWLTWASDRCSGPVFNQSWICRTPGAGVLGQLGDALDEAADHQGERAGRPRRGRRSAPGRWPASRGTRSRSSQRTAGDSRAESSSAMASGITTMLTFVDEAEQGPARPRRPRSGASSRPRRSAASAAPRRRPGCSSNRYTTTALRHRRLELLHDLRHDGSILLARDAHRFPARVVGPAQVVPDTLQAAQPPTPPCRSGTHTPP